MLTTYQEVRGRIYTLAYERDLRIDWAETTPLFRLLLLYDHRQVVVARASVPVKGISVRALNDLQADLEHVFGKDWLQ
ncbi:hypothetical protein [Microtetraspora sp. NBRC 16547]|uniref:hypothetical protein n=1 Tax=Microtetraspora sp. NBRC 16547 TaxID=3030993 RepID=UPI00249FE86B|nr:hypothetical protein [Microtetraspora sp. NBRC 16547]GLX01451.1 hypothetical protein Misp02_55370 [Microtetraspora sp. NBRC 16547]